MHICAYVFIYIDHIKNYKDNSPGKSHVIYSKSSEIMHNLFTNRKQGKLQGNIF